jgi:hypothetical protein
MALDHPGHVLRLSSEGKGLVRGLESVPTWEAFSRADIACGLGY